MAGSGEYCWTVICKNHRFHNRENLFSGHRSLLGETDAYSPQPALDGEVSVRCDHCGKEYLYKPKEVLRAQLDSPINFRPHPLFQFRNVISVTDWPPALADAESSCLRFIRGIPNSTHEKVIRDAALNSSSESNASLR
jgi:hypothetical protein